jgi:hypothetical protein
VGDAIWTNKCPNHIYDFDEFLISKIPGKICVFMNDMWFIPNPN